MKRSPLVSFFVLAFALCWGIGAVLKGAPIIAPDGLFVIGILLTALIVTRLTDGRLGLLGLARRLVRWRVGVRWYAAVAGLPVFIVGLSLASMTLLGATPLDWTKRPALASMAVLLVFLIKRVEAC